MKTCSIENCERKVYSRGWCQKHYCRWRAHGDPSILLNLERFHYVGKICKVDDCKNPQWLREYCQLHYSRIIQFGRTYTIKRKDGEGQITSHGYKFISVNGERIYEHIYLAEKALGKKLPDNAIVHHMNEDKLDNFTPFNLVICPDQAYHMHLHKLMRDEKQEVNFQRARKLLNLQIGDEV